MIRPYVLIARHILQGVDECLDLRRDGLQLQQSRQRIRHEFHPSGIGHDLPLPWPGRPVELLVIGEILHEARVVEGPPDLCRCLELKAHAALDQATGLRRR
jgi:hypothetical protein